MGSLSTEIQFGIWDALKPQEPTESETLFMSVIFSS